MTIDHHKAGLGLVSTYLHLQDAPRIAVGEYVEKGEIIATVGPFGEGPHLHFELRIVIDEASSDSYWDERQTLPVDPTRLLYRWEDRHTAQHTERAGGKTIARVGSVRAHGFPFFVLETADEEPEQFFVPLYEPMTEQERLLISLARDAYASGRTVELRYRQSEFFGAGTQNILIDVMTL